MLQRAVLQIINEAIELYDYLGGSKPKFLLSASPATASGSDERGTNSPIISSSEGRSLYSHPWPQPASSAHSPRLLHADQGEVTDDGAPSDSDEGTLAQGTPRLPSSLLRVAGLEEARDSAC